MPLFLHNVSLYSVCRFWGRGTGYAKRLTGENAHCDVATIVHVARTKFGIFCAVLSTLILFFIPLTDAVILDVISVSSGVRAVAFALVTFFSTVYSGEDKVITLMKLAYVVFSAKYGTYLTVSVIILILFELIPTTRLNDERK